LFVFLVFIDTSCCQKVTLFGKVCRRELMADDNMDKLKRANERRNDRFYEMLCIGIPGVQKRDEICKSGVSF